jgi:quinol monooxygenase YgiN
MWMQIIKMRQKHVDDAEIGALMKQLQDLEEPNSGLVRSIAARDQKDPSVVYTIVTFESEEHARAREQDERRQEGLQAARQVMSEMFEGPPEFIDLNIVTEHSPT